MEQLLDKILKSLQDGASTAVEKAENLTRLGHARLEIAAAKNKISQLQIQLGAEVYQQFEAAGAEGVASGVGEGSTALRLCEEIYEMRNALRDRERDLEELREELSREKADGETSSGDEDSSGDEGNGKR